jgi:CO/xanthine dehydrogenase Mo-binding subunit
MLLGIQQSAVTVNVTLLGGGFGRKSTPDYVAEAAFLARAVGAPMKVTWTREDDLAQGYLSCKRRAASGGWPGRERQAGGLPAPHGVSLDRIDDHRQHGLWLAG